MKGEGGRGERKMYIIACSAHPHLYTQYTTHAFMNMHNTDWLRLGKVSKDYEVKLTIAVRQTNTEWLRETLCSLQQLQ